MSQKIAVGLAGIERDAAAYGMFKLKRDGVDQAVHWRVTCGGCDVIGRVPGNSHSPPNLMAKNMNRRGWKLREGKSPQCPRCANPRKDNPDMNKAVTAGEVVNAVATAPHPKILRVVFELLGEHFDQQKMLYRNGWTDARIAKECGTSEQVVIRLRDESYGKLSEDPEVTSLKDDLSLLTLEINGDHAKLSEKLAAFGQRIERIAAGRKV